MWEAFYPLLVRASAACGALMALTQSARETLAGTHGYRSRERAPLWEIGVGRSAVARGAEVDALEGVPRNQHAAVATVEA